MSDPDGVTAVVYRRLFFHSLLAFTIAFILSNLIHEGAHAVTARALGLDAVLHHNYVATSGESEPPAAGRLWVPASGPLVSLLLGAVCLLWVRTRRTASLGTLTVLWLGLQGFVVFFGYLMLGPLVAYGDTGKVYTELSVPGGARWAIALVALVALAVIVRSTATDFERHVLQAAPGDDRRRGRNANALIAFPILAGAALTTLLSLPVPTFVSLIHPLTSPFVIFMAYGVFRRRSEPLPHGTLHPDLVSVPLVVATLILVTLSRLLVPGLPLG